MERSINVLVVDVGGTHVKILATGQKQPREFPSGPKLTPKQMVAGVKKLAKDWKYNAVSIGYPGVVIRNRPVADPYNLGNGWAGFDFEAAFKCPVKVINDAAMQALGSYKHGKMLFLGLGTGLGSAMVVDGIVEPMELGHLPYRKRTFEDYVGAGGRKRLGQKKWEQAVKRCDSPSDCRARTRGCGFGRRKRQKAEKIASRLQDGRQCQCIRGRISRLGENRSRESL